MKRFHRYLLSLLLLNILFLLAAYLIAYIGDFDFIFSETIILAPVFSVISGITALVFFTGQTKTPESQIVYSIVAISLKFLLEIILALIWFVVAKKTSLQSILIFFVLYLALTLFTVCGIVKTLKNKAL